MKRWQDRGEVQDSDDEELSLDAESQSPEHARKKPRLDEIHDRNETLNNAVTPPRDSVAPKQDVEEEADWLQPRVATTCGKRPAWRKSEDAQTSSRTSSQATAEHVNLLSSSSQAINNCLGLSGIPGEPEPSQSTTLEELPDADQLIGGIRSHQIIADKDESPLSSVPASPLFEPERLSSVTGPEVSAAEAEVQDDHVDISTTQDSHLGLQQSAAQIFNVAANVGNQRTFRARNEKQLHPYMYELAQYQKQCRERGVRPIRVAETQLRNAKTQDGSQSGSEEGTPFESSSPLQSGPPVESGRSLSPRNDQERLDRELQRPNANDDDELPSMSDLLQGHHADVIRHARKRRKHSHRNSTVRRPSPTVEVTVHDEYSIPPSPPLTSSGPERPAKVRYGAAGFRIPRGLTPSALPTPQVSSEAREDGHGELSLTRPSPLRGSAARVALSVTSSDESSGTESEQEGNNGRLRRETRRIRGVLPASWLKIDFREQQQRAEQLQRAKVARASLSPLRSVGRRGVAQRVFRSTAQRRHNHILIADDDSDSDAREPSQSPSRTIDIRRAFAREAIGATMGHTDLFDDDHMEADWIDPMFVGPPSKMQANSASRKNQPKIAEAFSKPRRRADDFSEELRALQAAAAGRGSHSAHRPRRQRREGAVRQPPKYHQLSVVDGPARDRRTSNDHLPHFLKLAMRTARKRPNQGRHSPTRKHIRLATIEDTEDATTVLSAWREGSVMPSIERPASAHSCHVGGGLISDNTGRPGREPLAEIFNNPQQRLPPPLRKVTGSTQSGRTVLNMPRRARLQQTRLQPIAIERGTVSSPSAPAVSDTSPAQQRIQRRPRAATRIGVQYRSAQLETLEDEFNEQHRGVVFARRMRLLIEKLATNSQRERATNDHLQQLLDHSGGITSAATSAEKATNEAHVLQSRERYHRTTLPRRPRKRPAHRLNAEARQYRQPSEPVPDTINVDFLPENAQPPSVADTTLQGLGPFGTRYAKDFDVLPLAVGTYFHQSSFIGSGDFAAALTFTERNLDVSTGRISIFVDEQRLDWGLWTEDVSAGLAAITKTVSSAIEGSNAEPGMNGQPLDASLVLSNVDYLLRSIVRYVTRCLAFSDPIDRRTCILCLHSIVEDLLELGSSTEHTQLTTASAITRSLQYAIVLAHQVALLCNHSTVQADVHSRCFELLHKASIGFAKRLCPRLLPELRTFLEENRYASKRDGGIKDSDAVVSGLVVLHHIARAHDDRRFSFWNVLAPMLAAKVEAFCDVSQFDAAWYNIYSILPLLEIEASGIARIGSRLHMTTEDWTQVKQLLIRLLALYPDTGSAHGATINDYIRATMSRCYTLTTRWGWWKCESILGVLFDFFARRGLAPLHREESDGSPRFLEDLSGQPPLEVQPEDRSFHIFLKHLAAALIGMRKHGAYTDKKIQGIAWRFIPNHGRLHRKDAEVRQEDLDALRHHHDLLCTLYYATPAAHRLRVDLIRGLVDHSTSHREACRINVRAWGNLAAFQASTNEGAESLDSILAWFKDMLSTTIGQYRLARTEVEHDVAAANAEGQMLISKAVIETTIARNQRQIAATLTEALAALKRTINCCSNLTSMLRVVEQSIFWRVFDLFDPSNRRLSSTIDEALEVVKLAMEVNEGFVRKEYSQADSEESQDYGDFTAIQELASTQANPGTSSTSMAQLLHTPMAQLLSNAFGADTSVDDATLIKLLEVWVSIAHAMVQSGLRAWTEYIDSYAAGSWSQLRDTDQKRKYTPYFLSLVVGRDDTDAYSTNLMSSWLISLVEREAMLKFQHRLTNALLNHWPRENLLQNPPFTRTATARFEISLQEFRQRRTSMISTVLCNMHQSFQTAMYERPSTVPELRRTYADLLKHLMQTMKVNYQELQATGQSDVANVQVQGAYVEFVQHVVSSMQQYTTDICQVDRFFTDSAAFPLPATDPTYVVGRLRAYVPKLADSGKRKGLAVFVQTVSERAAVDNQQAYLVDQLATAMTGVLERGDARAPSLRHVMLTAIVPAYIESALATACSWIVARPLVQACARAVGDLLYCTIWENADSVQGVVDTLTALLRSMTRPLVFASLHPGQLMLPHAQSVLAKIFAAARQCLTCVKALTSGQGDESSLRSDLDRFMRFAEIIETRLRDADDFAFLDTPAAAFDPPCPWLDTLEFSRKQARDKLGSEWYASTGQYFVRRGTGSVEVIVALGDEVEEKEKLLRELRSFQESYEIVFARRTVQHGGHASIVDEIII